jgi:hypothetical protein
VAFLNRLLKAYACTVADWHGSAYMVSTYTGKTEIAGDLAEVWQKVEQLTGVAPDPLSHVQAEGTVSAQRADG